MFQEEVFLVEIGSNPSIAKPEQWKTFLKISFEMVKYTEQKKVFNQNISHVSCSSS